MMQNFRSLGQDHFARPFVANSFTFVVFSFRQKVQCIMLVVLHDFQFAAFHLGDVVQKHDSCISYRVIMPNVDWTLCTVKTKINLEIFLKRNISRGN